MEGHEVNSEHMQYRWSGYLQEIRVKDRGVSLRLNVTYFRYNTQTRSRDKTGQKAGVWVFVPAENTEAISFLQGLKDQLFTHAGQDKGADIWKAPPWSDDPNAPRAPLIEVVDPNGMETTASVKIENPNKAWLNFETRAGAKTRIGQPQRQQDRQDGGGRPQRSYSARRSEAEGETATDEELTV